MIAFRTTAPRLLRVVAAVVAASMSCAASAALITVGPDPDCDTNSLPAAMLIAGLNGTDFDEIRVMQGTYTNVALSSSGISYSLTGGYNHCRLGALPVARTNLVGNLYDRVLSLEGATNAYHNITLSHLNISNGGARANRPLYGGGIRARDLRLVLEETAVLNNSAGELGGGGGIFLEKSSNGVSGILELQRNVRVFGNWANHGGGIEVKNASLRIRPDGTDIFDNTAQYLGGGIRLEDADFTVGAFGEPETSATASGLVIRGNTTISSNQGSGGGVSALRSFIDLRETAFIGNRSLNGAGISVADSQLQMGRDASGLHVGCPNALACMRFEDNWSDSSCPGSLAGSGGAIRLDSSRAFIHQTKFTGNCAMDGAVLSATYTTAPAPAIDIEGVLAYDNYNYGTWRPSISVAGGDLRIRYSTLVRSQTLPIDGTAWQKDFAVTQSVPSAGSYIRTTAFDRYLPTQWGDPVSTCSLNVGDGIGTFRDPFGGDFRLAATANSAIDRCNANLAPIDYTDLERKPRCTDSPAHANGGGHCDIGAFEYDDDPFGYGFGNGFE